MHTGVLHGMLWLPLHMHKNMAGMSALVTHAHATGTWRWRGRRGVAGRMTAIGIHTSGSTGSAWRDVH